METSENVARIRDNLLLIPAERFDLLAKDAGYLDSFIYYVACIILSIPFSLLVAYFTGSVIEAIVVIPVSIILSLALAYVIFALQHLLLRLVGGQGTLLQSVQVFIYGSTPSVIFGPLPIISILTSLLGLANVVVGAARVHRISLLRAIVAVIVIPTVVLIAILLVAVYFIGLPAA